MISNCNIDNVVDFSFFFFCKARYRPVVISYDSGNKLLKVIDVGNDNYIKKLDMLIVPFIKVGEFSFEDDYNAIKNSIKFNFTEDILKVIDKKYPRIYIEDLDLMINFNEDFKSVRFFEFFKEAKELTYKDVNFFSQSYREVGKVIRENDPNIIINESGLESEKLGITISRIFKDKGYSDEIESVLIASQEYISEEGIDLDDLYKSITGEDFPT
ncbi:hypothetical protein [Aquimarina aggregata]|uniref:hypothetical protein n=1 Tax=Aquimarina aggregata TaxID=1642818 RepID=UPI002493173A|nr:hypothetical protein [Aquimarina aggregata]